MPQLLPLHSIEQVAEELRSFQEEVKSRLDVINKCVTQPTFASAVRVESSVRVQTRARARFRISKRWTQLTVVAISSCTVFLKRRTFQWCLMSYRQFLALRLPSKTLSGSARSPQHLSLALCQMSLLRVPLHLCSLGLDPS